MNISHKNTHQHRRQGLSLIEVLIALSMTLIVLVAMMQAFRFASNEMAKGRASVEMTNSLRSVEDLLRSDLRSLTVDVVPHYNRSSEPLGYFEIVDGRATDINYIPSQFGVAVTPENLNRSVANLAMGDYDDILSGTIRTSSIPFRGRFRETAEESSLAEVIWFTIPNDRDGDFFVDATERVRLHRRLLLVKPTLNDVSTGYLLPVGSGTFANRIAANVALRNFLQSNDVSVSVQAGPTAGTFVVVANSLERLSFRANRYFTAVQGASNSADYRAELFARLSTDQQDIVMNDVAAFDVQVFDPSEPVGTTNLAGGLPFVTAPEFGLNTIATASSGGSFTGETGFMPFSIGGSFVDLGKGFGGGGIAGRVGGVGELGRKPFGFLPINVSTLRNFVDVYYDTGTPAYERNNFNDNPNGGNTLIDEGRDGIDNDNDGLIDESAVAFDANTNDVIEIGELNLGEMERPAPYNVSLRGLKVVVRAIEPQTNQVSQISIKQSFVSE